MGSVYITKKGDRYHARPDCSWITAPQKTAVTMGWTVYPAQEVSLIDAEQQKKGQPCPLCV
jgi:hypothetical protein